MELKAGESEVPKCGSYGRRGAGRKRSGHVGCERRKSRLCRGEEEGAEAFFPPPSDDELGRSKAAMREQTKGWAASVGNRGSAVVRRRERRCCLLRRVTTN
jgi:hypothetical protein